MNKALNENDLNNLRTFSQSLGKILWQIGAYSIIQIIAAIFLAIVTIGSLLSAAYETSISVIFDAFQSSIWTILITSIILEVISYYFILKIINLLMDAKKKGIPYKDKYNKSALSFLIGIVVGIFLFIVAIILMNWLLHLIREILYDPSFEIEDLEQIPSTGIISTLVEAGRIFLSLAGFYFLRQNFEQLRGYMLNAERIMKGFQLLIIGFVLLILGSLIGIIAEFASFLGLIGLILTIVGYFNTSNGLKTTIWKLPTFETSP